MNSRRARWRARSFAPTANRSGRGLGVRPSEFTLQLLRSRALLKIDREDIAKMNVQVTRHERP